MTLLKITINDEGEHWDKIISVFGIVIYHRHDFTKEPKKNRPVGFNVMPSDLVEIEDYEYFPEEFKRKDNEQV